MRLINSPAAAVRSAAGLALVATGLGDADTAFAAGTLAGTAIVNVATADYIDDTSTPRSVTSNAVTIRVEEVLDVGVSPLGTQPQSVIPGAPEYTVAYRVTNAGNGPEPFFLVAGTVIGGDAFDPGLVRIAVDRDGDGIYNPLVDTDFAPGSEPLLAPDASVDVFVFVSLPSGTSSGDEGRVSLTATALTGSGAPGTLIAGAGTGGSDAVVGNSRAEALALGALLVGGNAPTLAKAQSFSAAVPVAGTIVTYTITADLVGSGAASPIVADPIPAGVSFVPGSIRLDGVPMSDAADADAGTFTGAAVEVALSAAAGGPQVITFQVRVN